MKPAISIVTPSFNQAKFIERTIRSVLDQEIGALEYFIADGGSIDGTLEVIRKYDDRLSYVSEKDNGQAAAVNKGIHATTGDIIGWLNSDDIYYPGTLSTVVDYFARHPETEVVYGEANHIDENDAVLEPYYAEDWNYERLKEVCFLCQPAVFFRRRIVDEAGLLDEALHYCMDYDYWLRLGKRTPFARIRKGFAGSRMYRENKTLGSRVPVHGEINDMFLRKMGHVPDKWIYAYAHAIVEERGMTRDSAYRDLKFVLALTGVATLSFMRWQRRVPSYALKTMSAWVAGSFRKLKRNGIRQ
jgi:glycosyltransferase involved in cell wall biosynthesis